MAHQNDVSSENTQAESGEYLTAFFKEWMDYFEIDIMGENELCELLLMVNRAAENGNRELIEVFDGMPGGGFCAIKNESESFLRKNTKKNWADFHSGRKNKSHFMVQGSTQTVFYGCISI